MIIVRDRKGKKERKEKGMEKGKITMEEVRMYGIRVKDNNEFGVSVVGDCQSEWSMESGGGV